MKIEGQIEAQIKIEAKIEAYIKIESKIDDFSDTNLWTWRWTWWAFSYFDKLVNKNTYTFINIQKKKK